MRILHAPTRFGETGEGDIKALSGEWDGYFRLRVGEFRVIFQAAPDEISIIRVRNRSDVYRLRKLAHLKGFLVRQRCQNPGY